MRKNLASFILIILLISTPLCANGADSENGGYDAIDKLARGAVNLLVSPLEFLQGMGDAFSEHDIALAWPVGLFNATWKMVRRAGVGVFEIVTFPLPQPADYGPIIEEPAFLGRKKALEEVRTEKRKEVTSEEPETEEPSEKERLPIDYLPDSY